MKKNTFSDATRWRLPAEWEPQSGVQLTWPHENTDWAPMLDEVRVTYKTMAREISKRERLLIVTPDKSPNFSHSSCINAKFNVHISNSDTDDTWARDHGFLTLTDDEGHFRLMDYCFNGWGMKYPAEKDNAINRHLYAQGQLRGEYTDCLDFVLEGGSIESDGRGTIMTTSHCLLAPHRNQPMKKNEISERLMKDLGAENVIWIEHGLLTGDDTDGHIDTLVRLCPDDTLLYVGCDDTHDEQYQELKLMEEQLHTLRTMEGRPYKLKKLPMPRPIYERSEERLQAGERNTGMRGERLPATYANFLVVNGAVLCPTYGQPDLDEQAMHIVREAFPGRETVGIDCHSLIRQHGSLHCCTMQFPMGVFED